MDRQIKKESVQTDEAFKGKKRDACTAIDESQEGSYAETIADCVDSGEDTQLMFGVEFDVLTACVCEATAHCVSMCCK